MTGVFDLEGPADLLKKLHRELELFRADPLNVDYAFNLFVTAEHILDWVHPGNAGRNARDAQRISDPLLEAVSHLANRAKHFDKLRARHKSVKSTEKQKAGSAPTWARRADNNWFPRETAIPAKLVVHLDGAAEEKYGATVPALVLAEEIYQYWSTEGRIPT